MRWTSLLVFLSWFCLLYGKETTLPPVKGRQNHHTGHVQRVHTTSTRYAGHSKDNRKGHQRQYKKLSHKHHGPHHHKYYDLPDQKRSQVSAEFLHSSHRHGGLLQRVVDPRAITAMKTMMRRQDINKRGKTKNSRSFITHYIDPKKFGEILMKKSKIDNHKRMDIDINLTGKKASRVNPSQLGLAILKLMFGENANLVIQKSPSKDHAYESRRITAVRKELPVAHKHEPLSGRKETLKDLIREEEALRLVQGRSHKPVVSPLRAETAHFDTSLESNLMKAVKSLHEALEKVKTEKKKSAAVIPIRKVAPTVTKKSSEGISQKQLAQQISELLKGLKPLQKKMVDTRAKKEPTPPPIPPQSRIENTVRPFVLTQAPSLPQINAEPKASAQMISSFTRPKEKSQMTTKDISSVLEYLDKDHSNYNSNAVKVQKPETASPAATAQMTKQIDQVQDSIKTMMRIAESMEKAAKEIANKINTTPKPVTPEKAKPEAITPDRKSWVLLKLPKAQADTLLPLTNGDMVSQVPYDENPFNKEVINNPFSKEIMNVHPISESERAPGNPASAAKVDKTKVKIAESIQTLISALRASLKSVTTETAPKQSAESDNEGFVAAPKAQHMDESSELMRDPGAEPMRNLFTHEEDQDLPPVKAVQASDLRDLKEDLEAFAERGLQAHNKYRLLHHAKALQWSDELATQAEKMAYELAMKGKVERSKLADTLGYGENVARVSHVPFNNAGVEATKFWYSQVSNYSFNDPRLNPRTNAFTQVVWGETTQLGMGCAKDMQTNDLYVVALYKPRGNIAKDLRHDVLNKGKPVDLYSTIFKRNQMLWKRLRDRNAQQMG